MPGFTNPDSVFHIESPFGDVAERAKEVAQKADQRVGLGIAQVFGVIERDLKSAIREHPAWDSAIADRTRLVNADSAFEVAVDDERAIGLETGRDPATSPSPVIGPFLQQKTADIEDSLSAAITRGVGL